MTKLKANAPVQLHLGCGDIHLGGFTNIDLVKTSATDVKMDVRKLKYKDNSVQLIYAAHLIEHFAQQEVVEVLTEWKRVLKKGGKLVIVTPNFHKHLQQYLKEYINWKFFQIVKGHLFNSEQKFVMSDGLIADITGGALFPQIDRTLEAYHRVILTPGVFEKLAATTGFQHIKQLNLGRDEFPISQIDPKSLHYSSMVFVLTK